MARRGDADVSCSSTTVRPEDRLSPTASPRAASTSCTTTSVLVGPKADPAQARGRTSSRRCRRSPSAMRPSYRMATAAAAPMRPNCVTGSSPAARPGARATANAAAAWGRRSTWRWPTAATWLADRGNRLRNKADLAVLVEGDQRLFNQYGVMLVSAARHPRIKTAEGPVRRLRCRQRPGVDRRLLNQRGGAVVLPGTEPIPTSNRPFIRSQAAGSAPAAVFFRSASGSTSTQKESNSGTILWHSVHRVRFTCTSWQA